MVPPLLVRAAEEAPDPNDVVAGWVGFAVFVGLIVAVALLGWSLSKQLRKAQDAADHGVYGPPEDADSDATPGTDEGPDAR